MVNYYLYRLGQFIALKLPLKFTYATAIFISDLHHFFSHKDRGKVTANLKAIFPEKTNKQIAIIRADLFRNFAKYLVDFFRFEKLDKDYLEKHIKIENIHHLDAALSKGKGVILVTAHLGNWELGGVVIALLGYPLWVVALTHKEQNVNNFFDLQRQTKGIRVIPFGKAAKACLNVLAKNEIIALVSDRDFSEAGIRLNFFQRPAIFPKGAASFALKTGAAIIPGFLIRNKDDSFVLKIEKPLGVTACGNKDTDTRNLIKRYNSIFEDYIRTYPEQWFMFNKFWIT